MQVNKQKEARLSIDRVRAIFDYDPITGVLTRKTGPRKGYALGKRSSERLYTIIDGESYSLARVIWLHYYGVWPEKLVDHKDKNENNNRIDNLREASYAQNSHNRDSSRFNGGVSARAYGFQVRITLNGKRKSLGTYKTREEAEAVYEEARKELHGEFAP